MNKIMQQQAQGGFALILALLVSSVALAVGLSLLDITVKQLTLSTTVRESEVAFQAAAAGMNCMQLARNQNEYATQVNGETFSMECLGRTFSVTDIDTVRVLVQHFRHKFDWDLGATDACIDFDMFVIDASAAAAPVTRTLITGVPAKTCANGDVCTYAFSRGHNRSCSEITAGSIFAVQRELTAEF